MALLNFKFQEREASLKCLYIYNPSLLQYVHKTSFIEEKKISETLFYFAYQYVIYIL